MKAYKGFKRSDDGTLSCLGFDYEFGKTYKHEGEIKLCKNGFHACHELYQVWFFYPNDGHNVFYEVECGGKIIESDDGSGKFVCSEITLVQPVDMDNVALFDDAWFFSDGFAMVGFGDEYNFIDTEGKLLSEQWFDVVCRFSDGFAMVELNGKWNFISTEGKLLSDRWFDDVCSFSDRFARVKLGGKWNFINTKGKTLSEQWFDDVWSFFEGLARVELDGKCNFIDTEGKLLSDRWFDGACGFYNGFAKVGIGGNIKIINKKGEIV